MKILVNSGMSTPASVPQLMIVESFHQSLGNAVAAVSPTFSTDRSPMSM